METHNSQSTLAVAVGKERYLQSGSKILVDAEQRRKWVDAVAQVHGQSVRRACERILNDLEQRGQTAASPGLVLQRAQKEVYQGQVDSAGTAGLCQFNSDGDL
jgi:hypothetical protein